MKVSINRIIAERELYKFLNLDQTKKFRAIIAPNAVADSKEQE